MNSEIIKEWLNNICSRTGVSVSGNRTLRNDEVEKIVEYVENLEQALDEIEKKYCNYYGTTEERNDDFVLRNVLKEILQIIKKAKGE